MNYQISKSSTGGEGIFALQDFHTDDSIFTEPPYFFLQSLPNRQNALVCSCCYRFLGSVGLQVKYLQKEVTRQALSEHTEEALQAITEYQYLSSIQPCPFHCGELYCSEQCQQTHWNSKGHCYLCTGQVSEEETDSNPLYQLKVFIVSSNEIFLMICDIVAQSIIKIEGTSGGSSSSFSSTVSSSSPLNPVEMMNHYVRNIWWEAITVPKNQKKKNFQKTLRTLVNDLWNYLNDVFHLTEKGYETVFNQEWIAR
jgi:hypothetical protein